jgi:ubiquinone/menaquinone biosynthesis C-methylase UbiE
MASKSAYATDHSESVLASHRWRTLKNSAEYVIPYLKPGLKVLDVGCGPGSITVDFARYIPDGAITGIEVEASPLEEGRKLADTEGIKNVQFEVGDAQNLAYEDNTFDLVHSHQVLQHLPDPVKALSEMRRVVKPGGIVAARTSSISSIYPESEGLKMFENILLRVSRDKGGNPHPGNHIHVWARQAGFDMNRITRSAGAWCFSTPEERAYWGGNNANRIQYSGFAKNALEGGYATKEQLAQIAAAWRDWMEEDDGWLGYLHGEIICRK